MNKVMNKVVEAIDVIVSVVKPLSIYKDTHNPKKISFK